jgi:hypothetical protein
MNEDVSPLRLAIERKDWETASLYLVLGVIKAAEHYPAGALEELIAELAGDLEGQRHRLRRPRRGRE